MDQPAANQNLRIEFAVDIVSAYVTHNSVPVSDLPSLVVSTYASLTSLDKPVEPEPVKAEPAVPIKKSVTAEYIICLEDGRKFQSLRRHLNSKFNMTPDEYRAKWGLPRDYPMVAPNYSATRSKLAKSIGLGQSRSAQAVVVAPKAARKRSGKKAA